jgi:hypothetical protein
MPSKEVITFWLDMGAPISLLSQETDATAPLDFRTQRQVDLDAPAERPLENA